jgi:hypothetical protein
VEEGRETTVQTMRIAAETPFIGVLSSFGYFIPSTEIFVVSNGNETRQRAEGGTNSTARRANTASVLFETTINREAGTPKTIKAVRHWFSIKIAMCLLSGA